MGLTEKKEQGQVPLGLFTPSPDAGRGRAANPPTLLTRFAEELRRAPVAGGGRGIFDVGFLIFNYLRTPGAGGVVRVIFKI